MWSAVRRSTALTGTKATTASAGEVGVSTELSLLQLPAGHTTQFSLGKVGS